ncbi:unnamed protein product [Echinostoma caproni]|uniref:Wsv460 n=1 Tax=Echinostoma caproni TaxID=27848 RepID=A0A183A309_9TREM|nr:unnamed protein product [Echinostoma caproni]
MDVGDIFPSISDGGGGVDVEDEEEDAVPDEDEPRCESVTVGSESKQLVIRSDRMIVSLLLCVPATIVMAAVDAVRLRTESVTPSTKPSSSVVRNV